MELTELRLAPNQFVPEKRSSCSNSSDFESFASRKRMKLFSDTLPIHTSVDLHVKDPLPVDWEQCLDLESGKMYYLNRKTLRKSWEWPNNDDQKLDLELNISTSSTSDQGNNSSTCSNSSPKSNNNVVSSSSSNRNGTNMVALACLNCHLLVILSTSSPSCPNCKYVHSLQQQHKVSANSNTLSLLD